MSRLKSDVEGRLRLAETQISELRNSARLKDAELQVGTKSVKKFTHTCDTVKLMSVLMMVVWQWEGLLL